MPSADSIDFILISERGHTKTLRCPSVVNLIAIVWELYKPNSISKLRLHQSFQVSNVARTYT